MAYVPNILQPGYAPAWQSREADQKYEFQTNDGHKYLLYVPNSNQFDAYTKSLKKYKDVFEQIKTDVKNDVAITKNKDDLPKDFDHIAWAELLSSTFKKLNKTWGVNDKIWIRNKNDDGTKYNPVVLAITPLTTQRNAKRGPRKISAADSKAAAGAGSEYDIDPNDIEFGPSLPSITQSVYVRTKNGLKYYYHTEEDADYNNHFMIKNEMDELVDENGNKIDPYGDLIRFVEESKKTNKQPTDIPTAKREYKYESSDSEPEYDDDDYGYNNGIPPYEGATWDDEFRTWVSTPPQYYDDEEDEQQNEPEPEPEPAPPPAPIQTQKPEDRKDRRQLLRERIRQKNAILNSRPISSAPAPAPAPAPAVEDTRLIEARRGLPTGWEAHISNRFNTVYYFNTRNGQQQWNKPTMGGYKRKSKTTKKRNKTKRRSKKNKSKRKTHLRKRTTKRRI